MSRLVIPEVVGSGQLAAEEAYRSPKDKYKDRLIKYIPAESLALYTFADKFLIAYYGIDAAGTATKNPADAVLTVFSWLLVILGVVGTPIYLYRQRRGNQRWGLNAFLATVAFGCWIYTMGGSLILTHHWYNVVVAALVAPIFTFLAGCFPPKPQHNNPKPNPKPAPDPNANPKVAS